MKRLRILVLDAKGMVGHAVALWMFEKGHKVKCYGGTTPGLEEEEGELSDARRIQEILQGENYDAVINCSAIVNQQAEKQKAEAVFINSYLPHRLEAITADMSTVVVHRSTDCIYSGLKGKYSITDQPDGSSFYARTKAVGELLNEKDITIRTSLIGPELYSKGNGLFNWFYRQHGEMSGYTRALWTGLTTLEFAQEIEWMLQERVHGLFQLVPDKAISKYELLCLFEEQYMGNRKIIPVKNTPVDKSLVPVIPNGLTVPSYESMLIDMKNWTDKHRSFYNYCSSKDE